MKGILNKYLIDFLARYADTPKDKYKSEVVKDFWISLVSREASILGRKEVLTGKAKFGILGDGKEVPQVAMARYFKNGDFRSGYYRDQTFMFAAGLSSVEDFFAQIYADIKNDPFSSGRQMNNHFATAMIDDDGNWLDLTQLKNVTPDISPTAGQMARGLGIALASSTFRNIDDYPGKEKLSKNGDEISFVTIGDASTSEGAFWETLNAAAVGKLPMCVVVWDDGYGISVPIEKQTIKGSISAALSGFETEGDDNGIIIRKVKAWDYAELCATFEEVTKMIREEHRPALIHVNEVTQPLGHSTSGSHERYKPSERLAWEKEYDSIVKMGEWMVDNDIISADDVVELDKEAKAFALEGRKNAWAKSIGQVNIFKASVIDLFDQQKDVEIADFLAEAKKEIKTLLSPSKAEIFNIVRKLNNKLKHQLNKTIEELDVFVRDTHESANYDYESNLYSHTSKSAINIPVIPPLYSEESKSVNGYQVLNQFFDMKLDEMKELIAFGEDVGYIGDVNQGFAGLQEKYGEEKVFDTGIREWSIMGMAIGSAMRGLRPIAEIQYLDYLLYGLAPLSDDLCTVRYRSNGLSHAPAIIRSRGHRLEGIWHAGSPMGMIVNSLKGMYIIVPRNMVQAAGFYNTMLRSDDPALIIESLNGYRLKEKLPDNLADFTIPLGVPEILEEGRDITLVTYGSMVRIAQSAVDLLKEVGVSVELIDVQTLIPFDLEMVIVGSLKKTSRIVFLDEDVPGGATSYMLKKVLEDQDGYHYLDAKPVTITAKDHRPPYGSDGDYFTKPSVEDIYERIYSIMEEFKR